MSLVSFIISLGLLLGALLLAVTTAMGLAAIARLPGGWTRWPLAVAGKGAALFPLSALAWAAIGLWAGRWGMPVGSLMAAAVDPTLLDFSSRLAQAVWWWVPPLFLLALPLTGEFLAGLLVGREAFHRQVRRAGLLGIVLLAVIEDAFHLPGALAGVIRGLHSPETVSLFLTLGPPAVLGIVWWCLASAWPRTPVPYQPGGEDKIREGALAIGLSPQEVWKRHLMRNQLLHGLATLCSAAAWIWIVWIAYGCPGHAGLSHEFHEAMRAALTDPAAPLRFAWPHALCALFLWMLGRIFLPRPR